ncbi:nuclear transport factor 2 family protein [Serinicoccus profundi]|uniref:nuclear transport factor 2 family protein n=1 Tax=Serinicoccus profundi TaxID=1078471 RepID=UPI000255F832|nr:nuclear transport factor 2 family protein [Serinicoccus profundi]
MDTVALVRTLIETIDDRRWGDLPSLLAPDVRIRLVHTGETFDRESWVRFNADYPGFGRMWLEDVVGVGERAAARVHTTGTVDGQEAHFEVAMFVTAREGVIVELVEVWADCDAEPPVGTRTSG